MEDNKLLLAAKVAWMKCSFKKSYLSPFSLKQDLNEKIEWFESNLILLLNRYANVLYVSFFSKRWWNKKVAKARKIWARAKKSYKRDLRYKNELK